MTCLFCGASTPDHSYFCKHCGEGFFAPCASCGESIQVDSTFCYLCGEKVPEAEEEAPPVASNSYHNFFKIQDNVLEKYTGVGIATVTVPSGITTIGRKAFHECDAQEIILPSSLKVIKDEAFVKCRQLEEITIPEGVVSIGDCSFFLCTALKTVELPDSLLTIDNGAFSFCRSLKNINLPEKLCFLGSQVFKSSCSLEEIEIPKGITHLEEGVFSGCTALRRLVIPSTVTAIGESPLESVGSFHTCPHLTIVGCPDTVAETVANHSSIPFEHL